uniref:ATP synthase complex subunit 8 n=1 Tax=Amphisbaena schmidti TaxID=273519 RepID=Q66SV6_AMPSC|nr:ATP synthase F0 subunit 8 [Amphisbaena schmidti]AAT08520.1 ATP synthase F0 subunit 8 [Amphisbaena schmidti]
MPQLNPAPWLYLLILTWTALPLYMVKIMHMSFQATQAPNQNHKTTLKPLWYWPWS